MSAMGKRSSFPRKERDYYPTPLEAVVPLVPHLPTERTTYHEPCAGDGRLVSHLTTLAPHMLCLGATDIEQDALTLTQCFGDMFITNPPWDRKVLHPLIDHLSGLAPTWLLIDAGWAFTRQSSRFMTYCRKIVAVGRLRWIPESKMTGKDDCCWYLFDRTVDDTTFNTTFFGRVS